MPPADWDIPERPEEALVTLLGWWRRARSPELGEAIDLIGARADDSRPRKIPGKTVDDRLARWESLERDRSPLVVGELMRTLLDVPGHELPPRLVLLLAREPDPRIAAAALAALETTFVGRGATYHCYVEMSGIVVRHGDARLLSRLDAKAGPGPHRNAKLGRKNLWSKTAFELRAALDAVPARTEAERHRDAELLAAARRATAPVVTAADRKSAADTTALLAAIYADPADDTARQVYADALLERGDPRGEFITLQLARARGDGTPAGKRRENELLRTYVDDWLGVLAPAVLKTGRVFERGFLHAAAAGGKGPRANLDPAIDAIEWATVVDLDIAGWNGKPLYPSPVFKALRVLRGINPNAMHPDWKTQVEIERLVFDASPWFNRYGYSAMVSNAPRCRWRVQHLEVPTIGLEPGPLQGFWDSAFARGLRSIRFTIPEGNQAWLDAGRALAVLIDAPVPLIELRRAPAMANHWSYNLGPDGVRAIAPDPFSVEAIPQLARELAAVPEVRGLVIGGVPEADVEAIELAVNRVTSARLTFD